MNHAPRSFSGDTLEGDNLVWMIFMDEAGISNRQQEPWAVVSGVLVDADKKLVAVERHLDKLVERFIPEGKRNGFVFQAKHLFNGGGPVFKRDDPDWPIEKRLEIADHLAAIPKKFRLPIAIGFAQISALAERINIQDLSGGDEVLAAHVVAFTTCSMQVEMWLRQNTDHLCVLVVENNQRAKALITDTQTTYQSLPRLKKLYGGALPEREGKFFPYKRIKQRPLFEEKAPSSVLQLADFCAYVSKRRLMGDERYLRFSVPYAEQLVAKDLAPVEQPIS